MPCVFMTCASEINSNLADLSESMWDLAPKPLKKLYLHYHNLYGHQTWPDSDLSWRVFARNVTWHFDKVIFYSIYGHQS